MSTKQMLRLPPRPASRVRSSDAQPTPETAPSGAGSPDYSYSDISSSSSSQRPPSSSRAGTAVRHAAKSVAGAFVACFVPPDYDDISQISCDSHHTRPPYVPSGIPLPASGSSHGNRDGSRHSYSSTQTREEPGNITFTIEHIYKATQNFSPSLKIGQGGFGTVYKGTLDDGSLVAIKRAKKGVYDDHMGIEFQREIETLTQVKHKNLVPLLGFLQEGDERILVVEYVPNGTLREHLDGKRGDLLEFSARLNIAKDVAHAITYLHTYTDHPIIHRDIKSSNILLTDNGIAKVADFGFARLGADRDSGATHVSTQVKGTFGYLDPQYMKTKQLTEKSDVYSFGVLLVELVSGRRAIESRREYRERVTSTWAVKKYMSRDAISVLDPRLERNEANTWAFEKILQLALQCLVPQRDSRPSMKRCQEMLWSILKEYKERSNIAHSRDSSVTEE